MNKQNTINCNITKDLLPSYFEGLCTQDTKTAVEQHLLDCAKCRDIARIMSETDFVSTKTDFAEADYIKKIKQHLTKGLLGGMFLTTVILFGLAESITNNFSHPNHFLLVLPFLLIATKILLPVSVQPNKISKKQKILVSIGILAVCYIIILFVVYAVNAPAWETNHTWPFFMDAAKAGPFLSIQLHITALYLAALFIWDTCSALRGKSVSFICMSIYLTGGCTILAQEAYLHMLSDASCWKIFVLRTTAVSLLEGILITLFICLFRKNRIAKENCRTKQIFRNN